MKLSLVFFLFLGVMSISNASLNFNVCIKHSLTLPPDFDQTWERDRRLLQFHELGLLKNWKWSRTGRFKRKGPTYLVRSSNQETTIAEVAPYGFPWASPRHIGGIAQDFDVIRAGHLDTNQALNVITHEANYYDFEERIFEAWYQTLSPGTTPVFVSRIGRNTKSKTIELGVIEKYTWQNSRVHLVGSPRLRKKSISKGFLTSSVFFSNAHINGEAEEALKLWKAGIHGTFQWHEGKVHMSEVWDGVYLHLDSWPSADYLFGSPLWMSHPEVSQAVEQQLKRGVNVSIFFDPPGELPEMAWPAQIQWKGDLKNVGFSLEPSKNFVIRNHGNLSALRRSVQIDHDIRAGVASAALRNLKHALKTYQVDERIYFPISNQAIQYILKQRAYFEELLIAKEQLETEAFRAYAKVIRSEFEQYVAKPLDDLLATHESKHPGLSAEIKHVLSAFLTTKR